jgi:hypothetical protein
MWQDYELEGETQLRAVLEGYLVFLRREPQQDRLSGKRKQKRGRGTGEWYVHFLIPEEERQRAYLAGEGFTTGASLEGAQRIAAQKALELRGNLERKSRVGTKR